MRLNACIEDLKDMTPTENGKHCHSCKKTILDLTEKSESEIFQLYQDYNGELCGIVKPDQLNERKFYHPLKRFAFALMLVFGSTLFVFGNDIVSQFDAFRFKVLKEIEVVDSEHTIKGFVYSDGVAVSNAEVIVYHENDMYKARTNATGEFLLNLPDLKLTEIELYVGAEGFNPTSKVVSLNAKSIFIGKISLTKIAEENLINGKIAPEPMRTAGVIVCPKPAEKINQPIEKLGEIEAVPTPKGKIKAKISDSIFD